jgi:hypothetical protein
MRAHCSRRSFIYARRPDRPLRRVSGVDRRVDGLATILAPCSIWLVIADEQLLQRVALQVMVNLCHTDANLRSTAYCLLFELANTFDLPIKDQLMEPGCVCVSANAARFMRNLSLAVAAGEPALAVSVVDSALDALDRAPELARPLLDCVGPWWAALVEVHERDKPAVVALLAWPTIGSLPGLVDVAVGCLTEAMRAGRATEAVAEVVVAISDGGPAMGACVVSRLIAVRGRF